MNTTLPARSEHAAEQLAEITGVIREVVGEKLAMVILFGSYARGDWVQDRYVEDNVTYTYESDFDLLVVSEDRAHATVQGEARISGTVSRRLEKLGLNRPSSTIIVEDIAHLNKDLQRGQYFFTDVVKEGVLLFDSGKHTLAEPGPIDPVEMQQYARDDFEHWFKSANEFLERFEEAFSKQQYSNAAFQLHQATERCQTAALLGFKRHKPKTHDIEILDRLVCDLNPEFFTVFPRATEHQKHCFNLLKKAYIDARYKRDYVITKDELEYLAGRVRKLQELTKRICEAKIASMA